MKKKIYVVMYFSCYDEPYAENYTTTDKAKADEQFLSYVADIHETENEEFDEDEFKGKTYFSNAYSGHIYLVQLSEQEVDVLD
jgi:hypothetical protein